MIKMCKEALKLIIAHFGRFIKHLYVFILPFGVPYLILVVGSFYIASGLVNLVLPQNAATTLCRVLLTITPAIPTGIYALCEREDQYDSFSMDLCFVVWISTIVYAWKFL